MASLATHKAGRAAAGAAYAAAALAYLNAAIELAAYDLTVANANVGGGVQSGFGDLPRAHGHGEFLRDVPALTGKVSMSELINRRHQVLLAS